ncbi:M20/M25/M40 family metallo-hydrolase [Niveispirillum fermenti]|uniref:M20/M25/M40 family metallo-hydrolase n=1 Tax=Niveispirillum fermenti TaxID=1233113 RepID=UPI003A8B6033
MKRFGSLMLAGLMLAWTPVVRAADAGPYAPATLAVAREIQERALAGSGAFDFVESLTVRVGPRMAGTPAARAGHDWAMARFKELGLANVRVEPFTVEGWERGLESAAILSPAPQHLHVTALGYSVATPADGVTGAIARFDTLDDLLSAPDGSLEGKIAFVDKKMARLQDGGGYGQAVVARGRGPSEAARKGALALLIRSIGTDSHRFPHTGTTRYSPDVAAIPAAALSNPDADQLNRLLALGGPVTVRLTLASQAMGPLSDANVMGEIRGRELPEEIVVIAAHLDSWDLGTGALDDGAGVGIVLAAARILKSLPQPPRRTIRFILFGAEELGLVGARAYAAARAGGPSGSKERHQIGTEADFGAGPVITFNADVRPEARPVIDAIGRALSPLGIVPGRGPSSGGPDIGPLATAFGMATAGLGLDGTDYFDYHHTADDTLDKVDPRKLDQSVAAFASFAWLAAESPVGFSPVERTRE